jgi:hypothetical protein
MPVESLRGADAYSYAKFRSTLAESDCNAIFSDGTVLPVLIEDGGEKLYVEIEYRFYDPEKLPNFVRYDLRPHEREKIEAEKAAAEAAEAERNQKLSGSNWIESRAAAEKVARQNLAARQASRNVQNGMPAGDAGLTQAGRNLAQAVAARKEQRKN